MIHAPSSAPRKVTTTTTIRRSVCARLPDAGSETKLVSVKVSTVVRRSATDNLRTAVFWIPIANASRKISEYCSADPGGVAALMTSAAAMKTPEDRSAQEQSAEMCS